MAQRLFDFGIARELLISGRAVEFSFAELPDDWHRIGGMHVDGQREMVVLRILGETDGEWLRMRVRVADNFREVRR
jgi:hypothetical protein